MKKPLIDANLIKKYHQDIVFNYAEYPTKDHWSFDFKDYDKKKALAEWLPKNPNKPIFFYNNQLLQKKTFEDFLKQLEIIP